MQLIWPHMCSWLIYYPHSYQYIYIKHNKTAFRLVCPWGNSTNAPSIYHWDVYSFSNLPWHWQCRQNVFSSCRICFVYFFNKALPNSTGREHGMGIDHWPQYQLGSQPEGVKKLSQCSSCFTLYLVSPYQCSPIPSVDVW